MFGARLISASVSSSAGKPSAGGGALPKKGQGRRRFVLSDVEPSITIMGMCPAVERDNSQYTHGFTSRDRNTPQETS
jgi:hypothetical protein